MKGFITWSYWRRSCQTCWWNSVFTWSPTRGQICLNFWRSKTQMVHICTNPSNGIKKPSIPSTLSIIVYCLKLNDKYYLILFREGRGRGVCWIMGVKSYLEHNQVLPGKCPIISQNRCFREFWVPTSSVENCWHFDVIFFGDGLDKLTDKPFL